MGVAVSAGFISASVLWILPFEGDWLFLHISVELGRGLVLIAQSQDTCRLTCDPQWEIVPISTLPQSSSVSSQQGVRVHDRVKRTSLWGKERERVWGIQTALLSQQDEWWNRTEVLSSISKCTPHQAFSCSFEDGFLKKSLLVLIAPMFFLF